MTLPNFLSRTFFFSLSFLLSFYLLPAHLCFSVHACIHPETIIKGPFVIHEVATVIVEGGLITTRWLEKSIFCYKWLLLAVSSFLDKKDLSEQKPSHQLLSSISRCKPSSTCCLCWHLLLSLPSLQAERLSLDKTLNAANSRPSPRGVSPSEPTNGAPPPAQAPNALRSTAWMTALLLGTRPGHGLTAPATSRVSPTLFPQAHLARS